MVVEPEASQNFMELMNSEASTCCSICLDSVKQEAYLDRCFHKFCYRCITRWVEASTNRSDTNKLLLCPLCKTENSSIIHSFVGDSFQRHYIGKDAERSSSLSDSHRFRLRCYDSDPGTIYQSFDLLSYWKQHRYLKHNRWLHMWLKRELQSLVQVEDVDIIFHHILGVVDSFLRRIQEERKSMAEQKQREFRMLVSGAARPFIFEKSERFVDELELFLASGLSIDAYDEVYMQNSRSSRATDETVEAQEQNAQNILSNLYLEDSDS
ncbi:unnamed protein product [Victoria cruziana]